MSSKEVQITLTVRLTQLAAEPFTANPQCAVAVLETRPATDYEPASGDALPVFNAGRYGVAHHSMINAAEERLCKQIVLAAIAAAALP